MAGRGIQKRVGFAQRVKSLQEALDPIQALSSRLTPKICLGNTQSPVTVGHEFSCMATHDSNQPCLHCLPLPSHSPACTLPHPLPNSLKPIPPVPALPQPLSSPALPPLQPCPAPVQPSSFCPCLQGESGGAERSHGLPSSAPPPPTMTLNLSLLDPLAQRQLQLLVTNREAMKQWGARTQGEDMKQGGTVMQGADGNGGPPPEPPHATHVPHPQHAGKEALPAGPVLVPDVAATDEHTASGVLVPGQAGAEADGAGGSALGQAGAEEGGSCIAVPVQDVAGGIGGEGVGTGSQGEQGCVAGAAHAQHAQRSDIVVPKSTVSNSPPSGSSPRLTRPNSNDMVLSPGSSRGVCVPPASPFAVASHELLPNPSREVVGNRGMMAELGEGGSRATGGQEEGGVKGDGGSWGPSRTATTAATPAQLPPLLPLISASITPKPPGPNPSAPAPATLGNGPAAQEQPAAGAAGHDSSAAAHPVLHPTPGGILHEGPNPMQLDSDASPTAPAHAGVSASDVPVGQQCIQPAGPSPDTVMAEPLKEGEGEAPMVLDPVQPRSAAGGQPMSTQAAHEGAPARQGLGTGAGLGLGAGAGAEVGQGAGAGAEAGMGFAAVPPLPPAPPGPTAPGGGGMSNQPPEQGVPQVPGAGEQSVPDQATPHPTYQGEGSEDVPLHLTLDFDQLAARLAQAVSFQVLT